LDPIEEKKDEKDDPIDEIEPEDQQELS